MTTSKREISKVGFTDLDTFLKIAPIIGLAVLAYLQTLFSSKVEFDKVLKEYLTNYNIDDPKIKSAQDYRNDGSPKSYYQ